MTFKIHYFQHGVEGSVVIAGRSVREVQEKVKCFMEIRGLDSAKNNCWSEEIEDGTRDGWCGVG